jgi:hypothetical protein
VSVVRVFARVKPLPAGEERMNNHVGREHMWIFPDEVREMLAASRQLNQDFAMPRNLVARLVVFHIIDNVRGQVIPWRPADVTKANFTARAVKKADGNRTFTFQGEFAKRGSIQAYPERGHEGTIAGEFDVDVKTVKITRFRAYSEGEAWATSRYNWPSNPPKGRYPLVLALVDADDKLAKVVPPESAATGAYYMRPLGR